MKELLDRVDERDVVIGTTTKAEAHEKGYVHRVSAVYVFTNDDKLLVQLRKKDGLLDHSAAGHVKSGETYDDAAARELREELGLMNPLKKISVFYSDERVPARHVRAIHYFGLYETQLDRNQLVGMKLSEEEVIKMIPMTLEEIVEQMFKEPMKFTTGFKRTLNFYAKQK